MSASPLPSRRHRSTSRLFGSSTFSPLATLQQQKPEKKSKNAENKRKRLSSAPTPHVLGDARSKSAHVVTEKLISETTPPSSAASSKHSNSSSSSSNNAQQPSVGRTKPTRSSSIFGFKTGRAAAEDDTPPGTASSSRAPSFTWQDLDFKDDATAIGKNRNVLHHGDTQSNSGLFRRKKEYLVLTDTHLVRFKNIAKASDTFHSISINHGKAGLSRVNSFDTSMDDQSVNSEMSGDKVTGIPLEQVVAAYLPEDNRPSNSLEMSYLDCDAGQGSSITFSFGDADERDLWLRAIRQAADRARYSDSDPLTLKLAEYAARVVEREQDYDVMNFRIFKIVKRAASRSSSRSSHDEVTRYTPTICFLVIGAHKIHLINLPKNPFRSYSSSASLSDVGEGGSFGILTLTWISVSATDDSFTLAFRAPLHKAKSFQLASLASAEIATRLRQHDALLRPEWIQRPFAYEVPKTLHDASLLEHAFNEEAEDHACFDRTLVAFCVSYDVSPSSVRYSINYSVEDAPRFELLEPATTNPTQYSALQLLAIMRALRYNETFVSVSFANVSLDALNGLHDPYGAEYVCVRTKQGYPLKLNLNEQQQASALIQEIRALAVGNKKLRRMDFTRCIGSSRKKGAQSVQRSSHHSSSGVIEALAPLCKKQMTNVDWLVLDGIELGESDLDHLISMAADRACHFRAIAANNCGLTDRGLNILLDALRAQAKTLEAIELAQNPFRLVLASFSRQLDTFGFIRKLDLSRLAIASKQEPLLPFETLVLWRLEELRLGGVALGEASVDALSSYLGHSQSHVLRELTLSGCSLTGGDIAQLMRSLTLESGSARYLHLDVSDNDLQERHDRLLQEISRDMAPTHLSLRSTQYDSSDAFRDLLLSLAKNTSIKYLDIAKISLPSEANEGTCKALERLFTDNQTLEELDISGEESRLEISKLGVGINQALNGLKKNASLKSLRIQYQRLGLQGASTLADVLKENKTLQQLHCDCNAITLSGFTDLVDALARNRTLLYLPSLEEGRDAALRQTQEQIQMARSKLGGVISASSSKMSAMRRTFANIGGGNNSSNNSGPSPSPKATAKAQVNALTQWTEQDVQAALRLVSESWEAQALRLSKYLERNWRIADGTPLEGDEEDNDDDDGYGNEAEDMDKASVLRPGTAGSISKVLERVTKDRTPTMEKQIQLGDAAPAVASFSSSSPSSTSLPQQPQHQPQRHHADDAVPAPATGAPPFAVEFDVDTTPVFEHGSFSFNIPTFSASSSNLAPLQPESFNNPSSPSSSSNLASSQTEPFNVPFSSSAPSKLAPLQPEPKSFGSMTVYEASGSGHSHGQGHGHGHGDSARTSESSSYRTAPSTRPSTVRTNRNSNSSNSHYTSTRPSFDKPLPLLPNGEEEEEEGEDGFDSVVASSFPPPPPSSSSTTLLASSLASLPLTHLSPSTAFDGGGGGGPGGSASGTGNESAFRLSAFFNPAALKAADLQLTLPTSRHRHHDQK